MARILIVDDEQSIRETFAVFLRAEGHEVETAATADSALARLDDGPFDVLVGDIVMPGENGVPLLQAVRKTAPHTKVIMMTGEPTVETAAEAVRAHATDYLVKPVRKNAIVRSVNHAVALKVLEDERRRLEEANLLYQENLEHVVAQRTGDLRKKTRQLTDALEELKQAQEQIVQQERLSALGQMASGVAHDFNNALMPVLAFSEILLDGHKNITDEDSRRYLMTIRTAALDAAAIVERLRAFYRPRKAKENRGPVDLSTLLEQVVAMTRPRWRNEALAQGIKIEVKTDFARIPPFEANASELREAFTNLVLNAVDAMPEGGVLALSAGLNGDSVIVTVADTGIGMSDAVQQRCLDPFFTTKEERGTGLGLGITYGILKRHGGSIRVDSRSGEGTTFTLCLPLAVVDVPGDTIEKRAYIAGGLRVLVVDDDPGAREALVSFLERDGHVVDTAENGAEGFEKFTERWYDVIISDRAMPSMNGEQLARAVKASVADKPVILVSGFGSDSGEPLETDAADALLRKPITRDALRAAIAGVMAV